jgi:di/tricarboxylate transporter
MSSLIITILVILIAIILLSTTRLRPDLIALMVLLVLGISGVVDQSRIFSGFSSSAVMTILGISMISVALQQTGVANAIGKLIYRVGGQNETLLVLFVTLFSATLSLFMNNIAAVGVLLPAVMALSRRSQTPPSRLLMPLAFGTILGGMATLLTTSNIIVSGALKDAGLKGFGLLDYFPVGAPVVLVGVLYLITLGRKLLPKRSSTNPNSTPRELSERLKELYLLEKDLIHLRVLPSSPLVGKTIFSTEWRTNNLQFLRILPEKSRGQIPRTDMILHAGDVVIARGTISPEDLQLYQLEVVEPPNRNISLADATNPLAEVILSPHTSLIGKNLCEINFRIKYGLNVLGIWRQGKPMLDNISQVHLQTGDALLVQGKAEYIHQMEHDQDLLLLEEDPDTVFRPQKLWMAVAITLVTLTIAALDLLPVALVVLGGAVLLLLTGCMSLNDAIQRIEWKAIFLIAGMWPLTIAISNTGLASGLINSLLKLLGPVPPLAVAAIFLFLAMLFTQFMSGQVTPIIIIPLALAAAKNFGIDPHPLALAVALGCSLAFITPLGHPVNIMVMNPGGYTFKDFFRVGFPLTVLAFVTILAGLHFIWGL